MSPEERLARVRLAVAAPRRALRLAERFGSAAAVLRLGAAGLERAGVEGAARLLADASALDAERELRELEALGGRLLLHGEPGYPAALAEIPDPPPMLELLGELADAPALAVVGTRKPTPYGRRMATRLAGEAARAGLAVVSGLARGVDTAAHEAALEAKGRSWAVLGSGLGAVYPPENRGLAERLAAEGGAVLSEHPLKTGPRKEHFPRRNRVVSGLCFATLVVEGGVKSGALITAKCALEQGREVLAVPGPADTELGEGPNLLLRQGAKLAARLSDVLEELPGWEPPPAAAPPPADPDAALLLAALGGEERGLDELVRTTGWGADRVSRALTEMELGGLVRVRPGQRYERAA